MIEALMLAWALVMGADWRLVVLAFGAVSAPVPAAVALLLATVVGRRIRAGARRGSEVAFVSGVVGELRAGSSLRIALRTACQALPGSEGIARRLEIGEPIGSALDGLSQLLPTAGSLIEAAVGVGGAGGRMVPVFEEILAHAAAEEMAADEARAALAPVGASMTVLIGAPAAYLAWSAATGRLARLVAVPGGALLSVAGGLLMSLGVCLMLVLARRRP